MTNTKLTYTVHCYASVRVAFPKIKAKSHREAIDKAIEQFNWDDVRTMLNSQTILSNFSFNRRGNSKELSLVGSTALPKKCPYEESS